MAKILFTADLHIKLGQKNIPKDWYINRFNMFIEQLASMQDKADLLIIGGDIFDKVPTLEELELYFKLLNSIKLDCYIYSGNHEAIKKDTTFLSCLKEATNNINPLVHVVDDFLTLKEDIFIIPYNRLKQDWPVNEGKICCTHVRGEIPPHVKPEIDLDRLAGWYVVLAGDLHNYNNSQENILYPGSPYTTSFHREEVDTGAILLDTDTLEHDWLQFELPQLIRKTISDKSEALPSDYHHTIYELEGNLADLATVDSTDLVTKKVLKSSGDTKLMLNNMSLEEEVSEYLMYILQLDEAAASRVVKYMQDNL